MAWKVGCGIHGAYTLSELSELLEVWKRFRYEPNMLVIKTIAKAAGAKLGQLFCKLSKHLTCQTISYEAELGQVAAVLADPLERF